MPLVLELYGSEHNKSGHLIIDRNNLIITYAKGSSHRGNLAAAENRERMGELIKSTQNYNQLLQLLSEAESFVGTEDPRHDALEHMSQYDRKECLHRHYIFKEDINLDIIKLIFSGISLQGYTDLISEKCVLDILKVSTVYFSELAESGAVRKTEAKYREEKQKEFGQATETVRLQEETQTPEFSVGQLMDLSMDRLIFLQAGLFTRSGNDLAEIKPAPSNRR